MSSGYRTLVIKPLESLHLGLRNLGGVEEFSIDESSPLPLPSTVLGALGNAAGVSLKINCDEYRNHGVYDFDDFRQLITELFSANLNVEDTHSGEPYLWGPLIRLNGIIHVPVSEGAISDKDVRLYVEAAAKGYGKDDVRQLIKGKLMVLSGVDSRIGISINEAGTVGAMFKSSYVNYKASNLSLMYLVKNPMKQLNSNVIRLGGEGRVSLIRLEDYLKVPRSGDYAVALQPILIHSSDNASSISNVKGLECLEEVYGVFDGKGFKVRVMNIGLGFSEVCGFRRPMLKALPQGTVVKLRSNCSGDIAVGLLSELGYGSIYRVSL